MDTEVFPRPADGPVISVVMPVFNGAAFLERSIGSMVAQTFLGWELLAVDDGSTDDSYEQLCHYAASDPRIRVFRLARNSGIAAARNHALRQARGTAIAYLDCDDEYYPDHLSQVCAWQPRSDVLVFAYDILKGPPGTPGASQLRTWDPAPEREFLMQKNIVTPLGVTHRRGLLGVVGLFNEALHFEADWEFWKRLALTGASFLFLPLKSGRYYVRPDSNARTRRRPGPTPAGGPAVGPSGGGADSSTAPPG